MYECGGEPTRIQVAPCRSARTPPLMRGVWRELQGGSRMTARNKGFAGLAVTMLIGAAAVGPSSFAAPSPCTVGQPGCKTVDDPSKSNPKFSQTQRGNVDAGGTESTCFGAN